MKTTLAAAVAAFALGAVAFAGGAQAQCMWNGYNYSCAAPTYAAPYWAYGAPAYTYPDYWNGQTGYKPAWLPSYPGPRPSSGAGR